MNKTKKKKILERVILIAIIISMFMVVFSMTASADPCDYQICLEDSYGDGWNGGTVDLSVNGVLIYDDLTIVAGSGPEGHIFSVNTSDEITTDYTAGGWPDENSYYIVDEDGYVVREEGAGGTIPGDIGAGELYADCNPYTPLPGDDCTNPIYVNIPADLTYTNASYTCGRGNDYSLTCLGSYDGGEDIIYRLDVTADTTVDITMDPKGTTYTGICIDDVCPPGDPCMAKDTGSSGTRTLTCIDLTAGNSYFIMVDTWPAPNCIPGFDLTITEHKKIKTVHPTDPAADYTTIQDAIDAACDGDLIEVWNSTYYENVVVDKRLTIYSRDGADVTIVDGGGSGHVFRVNVDRVNITGFTVTNSGSAGIYIRSDHSNITGNTVNNNNGHGVDMDGDNNNVTYNTVNNNNGYGILLYGADFNNITDNTVNNNGESGIFLSSYCNDNVVSTNTITDNGKIGVYSKAGIRLRNADDNEIVCNLVAYNVEKGFYLHGGSTGNDINYNNIVSNGVCNATSGGWEWNFHNEQSVDNVDAENNYWCGCSVKNASINEDPGTVDSKPFLSVPSPCAPMQPCIPCTPPEPGIEVNKTVLDGTAWVKEIQANVSDMVRFRCEIHNNGTCCDLTNIIVTDILSDSLEYAGNATADGVPQEPIPIGPNEFQWEFPGLILAPCETITIEFDAHMIKCRNDTNTQNVSAWCEKTGTRVSDEDTVWVNCTQHPLWHEINKELDAMIGEVSGAIMPNIIQRRLVDKLEYAKELKENAKIECEAGNFDGALKKLSVAKSQVQSFASMVKITRRISPAAKASFLAESAKIIGKIDELIDYIETEHKC